MLRDDEMGEHELIGVTGWAASLEKGQLLSVTAKSCVSVVCFNARDLTERFDQARTKVYNMRLWVSAGEQLFSKLNNPMMSFVTDDFAGTGRHDLQLAMCSACHDNLAAVLKPWGIAAHQIPMPLNLFRATTIDTASGAIRPLPVRPQRPVMVAFRAEMDLVVAAATCPDLEAPPGARSARVRIDR